MSKGNIEEGSAMFIENDRAHVVTLRELVAEFTRKRKELLLIFGTTVFASVLYALFLPNVYRSEILLLPTIQQGENAAIGGQLGLVASFAGVGVNDNSRDVSAALATLESREFLVSFFDKYNLQESLLPDRKFGSPDAGPSEPDEDGQPAGLAAGEENSTQFEWEAYKEFRSMLSITRQQSSGLVTVSMEWYEPEETALWLNLLIEELNEAIKLKDLREANDAISYLEQQLKVTPLVGLQQVFYELIETQMRTVMLADVRTEYFFEVIDRAVPSQEKVKPKRLLISILSMVLGATLGMTYIVFSCVRRRLPASLKLNDAKESVE